MSHRKLGQLLIEAGVLSPLHLDRLLSQQATGSESPRIATGLFELGVANEEKLAHVLAAQLGHPVLMLSKSCVDLGALVLIPEAVAREHNVLPVAITNETITVAATEVGQRQVFEQIAFATGRRVEPVLALEGILRRFVERAYTAFRGGEKTLRGDSCSSERHQLAVARTELATADELRELVGELFPHATSIDGKKELRADVGTPLAHLQKAAGEVPTPGFAKGVPAKGARVPVARAPASIPEQPATPNEGVGPKPGEPSVLVVEDDPAIRNLLARTFRHDGAYVFEAASGDEAVRALRLGKPHLVVLDAMLPGMHGFEICSRLKHSPLYKDVPVIMISAVYRGWEQSREIQEVHGADAFVEKPFDIHYLRKMASHYLGRELTRVALPADRADRIHKLRAELDWHRQEHDAQACLKNLGDWLDTDPFDPLAHLEYGNLLSQLGDLEGALRAYEAAVVYAPRLFSALVNLAVSYEQLGFRRKAQNTWRRASTVAPDAQTQGRITERVQALT